MTKERILFLYSLVIGYGMPIIYILPIIMTAYFVIDEPFAYFSLLIYAPFAITTILISVIRNHKNENTQKINIFVLMLQFAISSIGVCLAIFYLFFY